MIRTIIRSLRTKGIKIPGEQNLSYQIKKNENRDEALIIYYKKKLRLCLIIIICSFLFALALQIKNNEDASSIGKYTAMGLLAGSVISILVFVLMDYDLKREHEKIKNQWSADYSTLLHKLIIYLRAGYGVAASFVKIGREYERSLLEGGQHKLVFDEVLEMKKRLLAGDSQIVVIGSFGKNVGAEEYVRLGMLLTQNIKRGNAVLIDRLKEELHAAESKKLSKARKLAEEAESKLLIPMMLLLSMVLLMIMIPAFSQI